MATSTIDTEQAEKVARRRLEQYPIFGICHSVGARVLPGGKLWVGYDDGSNDHRNGTRFDLNIEGKTCWGASLQLRPGFRGKDLGNQLYALTEDIARDLGCTKIMRTASGFSGRKNADGTKETRAEWLIRKRGYTKVRGVENTVKKIL